MLSIGIVGLPNVGKSTLFNALTAAGAEVGAYPFTTIEANVGVVAVADERLEALRRTLGAGEATPCFVRFVDVAGLVEGASRGEGLGNRFLGEIRGVDAVAHVVRAFPDEEISHVHGSVDPARDAGVIETELLLADLEVLERAVDKRVRVWTTAPPEHAAERDRLSRWRAALAEGTPLARLGLDAEARREAKALGMITAKPTLYVANVGEDGYGADGGGAGGGGADRAEGDAAKGDGGPMPGLAALRERAAGDGAGVVEVSARLEAELAELDPPDRAPFLAELGLDRTGLERMVEAAFDLLGLVRFYTVVGGKLHAWEVPRGTPAPEAAGRVHTDMQEGFVRARVAAWDDLVEAGSFGELVKTGRVRTEGKAYEVRDGDVVEFLFT